MITKKEFNRWNNLIGWSSFLAAILTYLCTLEPTVSFWDCGEFITSAYKLEVGHPPGAPLFLMMAKICSLLAPNLTKVAAFMNALSALASAFTILFLFWTITRLVKKITTSQEEMDCSQLITILGSGLIGAWIFAFSDSFWFSAVESEVYASSSLFTAVGFWAILRWEENTGESYNNRWLLLIAYLIGLSIGVHLLNLLTIPAIVMVFYFKKYRVTSTGLLLAILSSFFLLALIQYGIIQGVIQLAAFTELLFVNHWHFSFNSGVWTFSLFLFVALTGGIWLSYHRKKVMINTILLALTMILLGYGSYSMIVIRSLANTPLNENKPDQIFSLLSYLNRDQYGDRPLLYGPNFNAAVLETKEGKPTYVKDKNKYVISSKKLYNTFDPHSCTFFPRMYSRELNHTHVYKKWVNITKDNPSLTDNMSFFLKYQLGYMYFRYFMWNFVGRQNNIEGNGGMVYGTWITGIPLLDNLLFGPQYKLPRYMKDNKGHNRYFLLPLVLGFAGMLYQLRNSKKDFFVTFMLFFMTGIAIVIYLNQTPLQPRERDYAYVGSFYAFAIWTGLGVMALIRGFSRWLNKKAAIATAICLSLMVPLLMAFQNYDDHNRANRYTAREVAYNYLNTCAPNAIFFTCGDNDTFPLWYLQEVENIRTDVRVINIELLSCDWYIEQQRKKMNLSDPIPLSLGTAQYQDGKRDVVYIIEKTSQPYLLQEALSFVGSDTIANKYKLSENEYLDYLPTRDLILPVDTSLVKQNGTIKPWQKEKIESFVNIRISRNYLTKNELAIMDILFTNQWKRPIYYTSANQDGTLGLDNYLQLEGFAYRLVPILHNSQDVFNPGGIESTTMFHNLTSVFRWGNMNKPGILIDDQNIQTQRILQTRNNFSRLALQLYQEGKKEEAQRMIQLCNELMPFNLYPPDIPTCKLIQTAFSIEASALGYKMLDEQANTCLEELDYYFSMKPWLKDLTANERSLCELTFTRLMKIAKQAGQTSLEEKYEKKFKDITGLGINAL